MEKNIVKIKNIKLGNEIPKICIPIVEKNEKDIIKYIKEISRLPVDIMEWRADFFIDNISKYNNNFEDIISFSKEIKKIANKPILFTLRSIKEGGNIKYNENIISLYENIIENKCFELIDLELLTIKEPDLKKLIKLSNSNNIKTIISNHDFNKTPSKKEIVSRIRRMIKLKCDIAKVAYMPKNKKDVITLLDASSEIKNFPIIAISMGDIGVITRIFGSVLTFASAKRSSAPGQIESMKLKYILDSIYLKN
ncbi:type I 3-dehydroquinate dehydratase [uncultured Brachyspira sp.]|uniref:type I 3-dehydroquinate dehydratase n=1 Tax=uncultured Brachyspira sp. TaxID=221953 RepID=UPI0025D65534|nr:type I 3-dehydroquinate dehydratase [uncultured Brachyspira sp.]